MNVRIFIALFLFTTINPSIAVTSKCENYQTKISYLQELNAKGGSLKQLETRRRQIAKYEKESYNCSNKQTIEITSNTPKFKSSHQKLRSNRSQNPRLQQLIKTCNYWIEQNNSHPSWNNTNYRDTACRAVDENENSAQDSSLETIPVRKLKECIKPNNVIDDDVNACMKGTKDPSWRH